MTYGPFYHHKTISQRENTNTHIMKTQRARERESEEKQQLHNYTTVNTVRKFIRFHYVYLKKTIRTLRRSFSW